MIEYFFKLEIEAVKNLLPNSTIQFNTLHPVQGG